MGTCAGCQDANRSIGKRTLNKTIVEIIATKSLIKNHKLAEYLSQELMQLVSDSANRNIKTVSILFRASEHKYKADAFREKCQGKMNTLLIA